MIVHFTHWNPLALQAVWPIAQFVMNCRKQLGLFVRGDSYKPPRTPLSAQKYLDNVHIRAYAEDIFRFLEKVPNSANAALEDYKSLMRKILGFLIPEIPEKLLDENLQADTVSHIDVGIPFRKFFGYLFSYVGLVINSTEIQRFINSFFGILQFLNPNVVDDNVPINLNRPPHKLPLTFWQALVSAASDIRPCYVILGVNTQRGKLLEQIFAKLTGALLLDIPTLIKWPLRPASIETARLHLMAGGSLTYAQSTELILECAQMPSVQYRGWIIPAGFHKNGFDASSLFPTYQEFEQRC
jgi:hypothetical protein